MQVNELIHFTLESDNNKTWNSVRIGSRFMNESSGRLTDEVILQLIPEGSEDMRN